MKGKRYTTRSILRNVLLCCAVCLIGVFRVDAQNFKAQRIFLLDFGTQAAPRHDFVMQGSDYNAHAGGCPNDGYYALVPACLGCFESRWLDVTEDATPADERGRMLILNAPERPSEIMKLPLPTLLAGREYEIRFKAANLLRRADGCEPRQPDLELRINGKADAKEWLRWRSGAIMPSPKVQWMGFSTRFRVPLDATGAVVYLQNTAPGGCGNDLALDDIELLLLPEPEKEKVKTPEASLPKTLQKPQEIAPPSTVQASPVALPPLPKKSPKAEQWNRRSAEDQGNIGLKLEGRYVLEFRDADKVDGDRISVLVNRETRIENATLEAEPLVLELVLDAQHREAEVLLIAENLGSIPPNTAQMRVSGPGGYQKIINLRSSESQNARVRLRYAP